MHVVRVIIHVCIEINKLTHWISITNRGICTACRLAQLKFKVVDVFAISVLIFCVVAMRVIDSSASTETTCSYSDYDFGWYRCMLCGRAWKWTPWPRVCQACRDARVHWHRLGLCLGWRNLSSAALIILQPRWVSAPEARRDECTHIRQ